MKKYTVSKDLLNFPGGKFTGITTIYIYTRTHDTLSSLWATAFMAQLAERRTRFPGS